MPEEPSPRGTAGCLGQRGDDRSDIMRETTMSAEERETWSEPPIWWPGIKTKLGTLPVRESPATQQSGLLRLKLLLTKNPTGPQRG